jgi:hypothetical protein
VFLTKDEKIDKAKRICDIYALGNHTIESAANSEGVLVRTFFEWRTRISEVSELYKEAQKIAMSERVEVLKEIALNGFGRLLTGFHMDEETKEYTVGADGKAKVSKLKTVKKYYPPSTGAIIFALKVADQAMFNKPGTGYREQDNDEPVKKQVFVIGGKEIEF